jgi:hypothetical protein
VRPRHGGAGVPSSRLDSPTRATYAAVDSSRFCLFGGANFTGVRVCAITAPLRLLELGYETIRGQGPRPGVRAKSFHT